MLTLTFALALAVSPQAQKAAPANPACGSLSAQEVASLIGTARAIPMTNSPTGSACMFQNEDKMVTILVVTPASEDVAKKQWDAQKRIATGRDVTGWAGPAYSAAIERPKEHAAIVGIVKGRIFVEIKVLDKTQPASVLETKLQTVMRALSGRI